MKLIIIGASSFIGKSLYVMAKEKGYDVVGTQFSSNYKDLIKFDLLNQNIEDVLPDITLKTDCSKAVVICSAIPKIDRCYLERDISYKLNVTRTIELIKRVNRFGVRIVFLSTEAVYDGKIGYYDETVPPSPINNYGMQKVEVENYIKSFDSNGLIFRLSMVVGDSPEEKHLFSEWYRRVSDSSCIDCIKGQIFSPTYVDDVAKGILISLEKGLTGLYHLTNSEYFTRAELAKQFLNITNSHGKVMEKPIECFEFLDNRSMKTYLDGSKFIKNTGMNFVSMKEVIRRFNNRIKR